MEQDVSERDVVRWGEELGRVCERMAPRFGRVEMQRRAPLYVRGLIARVDRKNGWQLADYLGDETPKNLQHFIARSQWNADEVRDDLQRYVIEHLAGWPIRRFGRMGDAGTRGSGVQVVNWRAFCCSKAQVLNAVFDRLAVSMVRKLCVRFLLSSRMSKGRIRLRRVRHGDQAIAVSI